MLHYASFTPCITVVSTEFWWKDEMPGVPLG